MEVVSGAATRQLVDYADAIAATRAMFAALDDGKSMIFPSIRGHGSDRRTRFGLKAAFDGERMLPGVKLGSYWPGNAERGLPNHGSTTLLLDDATGFPTAIIEASWLNALRTAASDAVAVDLLACPGARVLAVIGTGNQAYHDMRAVALVRPPDEMLVAGRNKAKAERLAMKLCDDGLPARSATVEEVLATAEVIVTATAARGPVFASEAVRPGTHVSAMGADGPGKQELAPALSNRALLFADAPIQSLEIGEFQHLNFAEAARITAIGAVIRGRAPGRTSAEAITIYDSSGIGLQDIAIAALALDRARTVGLVREIEF